MSNQGYYGGQPQYPQQRYATYYCICALLPLMRENIPRSLKEASAKLPTLAMVVPWSDKSESKGPGLASIFSGDGGNLTLHNNFPLSYLVLSPPCRTSP